ncbi:hypothetical protein E1B77_16940 [Salmonella enterica subsp. enterica]|nr:hypothetical protein [Salmonella enterica subsp. enterica]EDP9825533.1 hypothetical protein [Salmonella enterica subsp. enterica]EDS4735137.1 hypothetical protein [Salmonella enterica subsp. enterica serovar Oranienburg]
MSINKIAQRHTFSGENENNRRNGLILCCCNIVRCFIVRGHIYDHKSLQGLTLINYCATQSLRICAESLSG